MGSARTTQQLTAERTAQILWDSAWETLVMAFLAQIFGNIVIKVLGGLLSEMVPSSPPGIPHHSSVSAEATPSPGLAWIHEHAFWVLFLILFTVQTAVRLAGHSKNDRHRVAAAGLEKKLRQVSSDWWRLLIVNAFIAWATVLVIQIVRQFSISAFVWAVICDVLEPVARAVTAPVADTAFGNRLRSLIGWYGENQFKFSFWLLYSAAICDDLGLPNLKTLARRSWAWILEHWTRAEATEART